MLALHHEPCLSHFSLVRFHVRVVGIEKMVQNPVSLAQVVYPQSQVVVAFFRRLVHASGRAGVTGVPTRAEKATILQVTQEAVDRARVDRILLKTERVQVSYKLVAMDFGTVYEQQQARFQEAVDVPGTCSRAISISPTTMTIWHNAPTLF